MSRCASAAGPNASCAAAVAASPVTYGSRWPRPRQLPWHGATVVDDHDMAELGAAPGAERAACEITPPPRPVPSVSITRSSTPRAAPARHSAIAAAFASLSRPTGTAEALGHVVAEREVVKRKVDHVDDRPDSGRSGTERRSRWRRPSSSQQLRRPRPRARGRGHPASPSGSDARARRRTSPSRVTTPARIFVPPRSTPMACVPSTLSGYRNPPYGRVRREAVSVYRGGRTKGQGADSRGTTSATASGDRRSEPFRGDGGGRAGRSSAGSAGAGRGAAGLASRCSSLFVAARRLGASPATSRCAAASRRRTSACRRRRPPRSSRRTGCCSRTRRTSCCSAPTTRTNGQAGAARTGTPTR